MVKITIPSSSAQLTTKGTSPVQSPASFTGEAVALQQLGNALSQTSEFFRKDIVNEQIADAKIAYTQELNQLKVETLSNPELNEATADEFNNRAVELLNPYLDTIGDPDLARDFEVQQRINIMGSTNSVRKAGRVAQQDRYVVKGGEIKTQSLANSFAANDPVMQKVYRQSYVDHLNKGVPFNITREERARQIAIYDEEFRVGKPQHDFDALTGAVEGRNSTQRVLGAIEFKNLINDGAYNFKKGEAESWQNVADSFIERQIKNVQQEVADAQAETGRKTMEQVKAGEANIGQIKAANVNDPVVSQMPVENPDDTGALSNSDMNLALELLAQYKPKVTTNNAIWQEIRNNIDGEPDTFVDEEGNIEQRQLTTREIDQKIFRNMFQIDEEDYQGLVDANISEKKNATQQRRNVEDKALKGRIVNAVSKNVIAYGGTQTQLFGEGLTTFANGIADEYSARYLRKVINEKLSGDDLQRAASDVYDEFLKDNGQFVGKGKTPSVVVGVPGEIKRLLGDKESFAEGDFVLMPVKKKEKEE